MAEVSITDIRQPSGEVENLKDEILKSLPHSVPSLMVWSDDGIRAFADHCDWDDYYPFHREMEIVKTQAADICDKIPTDSVVIELGSGPLAKTSLILSELDRQKKKISYFALDVGPKELKNSVSALDHWQHVTCAGLLGTYDDCVAWLASNYPANLPKSVTFLYLGSTAGNVERDEASAFLQKFAKVSAAAKFECRFLVTFDGEDDMDTIERAYSLETPTAQRFCRAGLNYFNEILGSSVLDKEIWTPSWRWDAKGKMYKLYVRCSKDVTIDVGGKDFRYKQGDGIVIFMTAKWPEAWVRDVIKDGGMEVVHVWKDTSQKHGFYFCATPS